MHVEVEPLPHCITQLRIELPPERVAEEKQKIIGEYVSQARLPGYRPGKAPRTLVAAKFKKDIVEELKRKLVGACTREAIKEKNLRVLSVADVENVELNADESLRFAAKLVMAPEFTLPEYHGLPVKLPPVDVSENDLNTAIEALRGRLADFEDIKDRGLEMDDFAVIDFAGRVDGVPVNEAVPKVARELAGQEHFWIKMGPKTLVPGFCEPLAGAVEGETRDFSVELPTDFAVPELAGKKIDYTAKVLELKRQVLPEVNDEFAGKVLPGKTLADLKAQLRTDLEAQHKNAVEELKRRQIMDYLLAAVDFDLPHDYVRSETRRIMNDIVRENQERGVADDEIKDHETEIVGSAAQAARDRLKGSFVLGRIAEKEGLKVTAGEMEQRVQALAARYGITREKMVSNLKDRDALGQVEEEILVAKTLAFLSSNASVETVEREAEAP